MTFYKLNKTRIKKKQQTKTALVQFTVLLLHSCTETVDPRKQFGSNAHDGTYKQVTVTIGFDLFQ